MSILIKHSGIVSHVTGNNVVVNIQRSTACASCESKSACSTLNAHTQQIICSNCDCDVKPGDSVTVVSECRQSIYAVMVAFAIPLILFVLLIAGCSAIFGMNEGLSAAVAFAAIALYYVVLHFFDNKIKNKINFRIEKQIN